MSQYADVTATVSGGSAGSVRGAISAKLAGMAFPTNYHAELVSPTQYGNVLAGSAAGNQLSPNGSYAGGTSRVAFIGYVIAALVAVLLIAQAITGSWRLAPDQLPRPARLPVRRGARRRSPPAQQDTLAAAAGLLAVYALAVRLVIGGAARLRGRGVTSGSARHGGRGQPGSQPGVAGADRGARPGHRGHAGAVRRDGRRAWHGAAAHRRRGHPRRAGHHPARLPHRASGGEPPLRPRPGAESDDALAGIAIASGPDVAEESRCRARARPPTP